jgi:dihydroorotase
MKLITVFVVFSMIAVCQTRYDLLLKGGHVIDPANKIDSVMDVGITAGKITRVAANIPAAEGRRFSTFRASTLHPV